MAIGLDHGPTALRFVCHSIVMIFEKGGELWLRRLMISFDEGSVGEVDRVVPGLWRRCRRLAVSSASLMSARFRAVSSCVVILRGRMIQVKRKKRTRGHPQGRVRRGWSFLLGDRGPIDFRHVLVRGWWAKQPRDHDRIAIVLVGSLGFLPPGLGSCRLPRDQPAQPSAIRSGRTRWSAN